MITGQKGRGDGGLAALGFGKGDVLGILAPNIPEYAIVFHAVATTGGTITTINPSTIPKLARIR